jgi:hypothetical protein
LELGHVGRFEGHCPEEHGVEDNTCAPDVGLEAFVAFTFEDFGGDVGWGAALLGLKMVFVLDQFGNSEITDFNFAF